MTTPANWPNPERPGVPPAPFNQRPYLDHVLRRKSDNKLVNVRFFPRGDTAGYWQFANMNHMNERECAERFFYHTPVLTPTQIAEMLAGERLMCADVCRAMSVDNFYEKAARVALEVADMTIRNLGAAS